MFWKMRSSSDPSLGEIARKLSKIDDALLTESLGGEKVDDAELLRKLDKYRLLTVAVVKNHGPSFCEALELRDSITAYREMLLPSSSSDGESDSPEAPFSPEIDCPDEVALQSVVSSLLQKSEKGFE